MTARTAGLVAIFALALVPAAAEASRKLTLADLVVPGTAQQDAPLEISGTVVNTGDEQATATVRAYVRDTVGQMRIGGGRRVQLGPGREHRFSMSPKLPDTTPEGEYELVICAHRLNKSGTPYCQSSPLTVDG